MIFCCLKRRSKKRWQETRYRSLLQKLRVYFLIRAKKPLYIAHADKCKKCGMCMKPGCPAMTKNPDGTIHIDDTMCTGCGLCKDLCKFDAIELIKEGE